MNTFTLFQSACTGDRPLKTYKQYLVKFCVFLSGVFFFSAASSQVIRSAAGANAAAIQPAVEQFRSDLGGALNPNVAGSFGTGRREINWDGVPDALSAPNNLPANFFNVNSPRGAVFSTPGTGFQVSANASAPPVQFGNLNPTYPSLFETFSPQRLFTALGSNITDVTFFVPGTNTPAFTRGFGAIFTDVDVANVTSIQLFDQTNNSLGTFVVPAFAGNETFSFVGVSYPARVIARARITSGSAALGPNEVLPADLVVMDDFIYGEPAASCNVLPTFLNNLTIVLNTSCLGNDGNISIIPLSGTAPFRYSINGGMTYVSGPNAGFTFLNLGVGTYQLRLMDFNGCESAIVTRTIVQQYGTPPTFLNSPSIVGNVTCPGRTDGTITIIPTSGGAPFMYSINGGMSYVPGPAGGFTFTGLSVGPYQLRLKSANGCESAIVTRTIGTSNPVCPPVPPVMVGRAVNKTDVAIEASPNPSRGQVRVQLQNFAASKAEVLILDSRGTIIQKSQVSLTKHNIINFDLSRNAPGLYFIKVVSTDGIHSSKVLLQR